MSLPDPADVGAQDFPVYRLHCRAPDGEEVVLSYSPHTSELLDEERNPLLADTTPMQFDAAVRVSPGEPGRKSAAPAVLKIQLGLQCNYTCSYCNQSSAVADAAVTRTADSAEFLKDLDTWLTASPGRIEFWGGEPFLYFAKLKVLVPELRRRFPQASFDVVTNGSLIDEEILGFIEDWDIHVTVSHDGPGQHLRGPDPFDDPERAHWLREMWARRGGGKKRMAFNVVLTPANADVIATRAWLVARMGDENLAFNTEGAVSVYDERALNGSGRWLPEDYDLLRSSLLAGFENGDALHFRDIHERARDFILSLKHRRPSSALGQKCGMDRQDQVAVDLKGNVMTCQNTGAKGRHFLGNVSNLDEVRLDTATHWAYRESCAYCPVLQLCKGGCMFLDGDLFAQSCENEYHYNMAILGGVLKRVTGLELEAVTGDVRRPVIRRRIPVMVASGAT